MFADGVDNLVEVLKRRLPVQYFQDGSIEAACPPLRALLHIMAFGEYEGRGIDDPAIRGLFSREALLASDWYQRRSVTQASA